MIVLPVAQSAGGDRLKAGGGAGGADGPSPTLRVVPRPIAYGDREDGPAYGPSTQRRMRLYWTAWSRLKFSGAMLLPSSAATSFSS